MDPAQTILLLTAAGAFDGPSKPHVHQPSGCELEPTVELQAACQEHKNTVMLIVALALVSVYATIKAWRHR